MSSSQQHNERIALKRQQVCMEFMQATSTNLTTAKHYCQQTAYDLERAVSLFYDTGGNELPSDQENETNKAEESAQDLPQTEGSAAATATAAGNVDPVSSILNSAKQATPGDSSSSSFGGRGFSLNNNNVDSNTNGNESSQSLQVRVAFYKDGFTAREEESKETATFRHRGVHSIASRNASSISLLPPKREYGSNQQFIQDVQSSRVPVEFRRWDAQRRPIPVSILLEDRRQQDYPMEQWQAQQSNLPKERFRGAGQSLGGTTVTPNNNRNNESIVTWLLMLLVSWWRLWATWITGALFRRPCKKHVVNPSQPTTTIQLRFARQNKRERVEFNVDHTVNDLYRYCQIECMQERADAFELLAGFPPKPIPQDDQTTLKEAGLVNSTVEVRTFSTNQEKRQN